MRHASAELVTTARSLRQTATDAEVALWKRLRARPDGRKFRRQHAVGQFVFDFYCVELRVVVEVDGGVHLDQVAHNAERDAVCAAAGLRVVRVSNDEVLTDIDTVIARICAGTP